jgi:hypothetical protein
VFDVLGPSPDELRNGNEEGEELVWKRSRIISKVALGVFSTRPQGNTRSGLKEEEKPTNQLFSSHLSYVSFLKLLSYAFSTVSQSESRSDRAVKRAVNEDSLSAPVVRC